MDEIKLAAIQEGAILHGWVGGLPIAEGEDFKTYYIKTAPLK